MKIAIYQYQIENLSNWDLYVKKITGIVTQAVKANAQLLLMPEYVGIEIGGFHATDAELYLTLQSKMASYLELFQDLAIQHQIYIQPGTTLVETSPGKYINRAYFFGPDGEIGYQDKLQLIEYEKTSNLIVHGEQQTVFETNFGKVGIAICYDSEFPEIVRGLVLAGASLILAPSYTTTLAGYHRVALSCRARALENQCYVATAFTVGPITITEPHENALGQSAAFGPVESSFSSDGILAQCDNHNSGILFAELSFEKLIQLRKHGEVHNYEDTKRCTAIINQPINIKKL